MGVWAGVERDFGLCMHLQSIRDGEGGERRRGAGAVRVSGLGMWCGQRLKWIDSSVISCDQACEA